MLVTNQQAWSMKIQQSMVLTFTTKNKVPRVSLEILLVKEIKGDAWCLNDCSVNSHYFAQSYKIVGNENILILQKIAYFEKQFFSKFSPQKSQNFE